MMDMKVIMKLIATEVTRTFDATEYVFYMAQNQVSLLVNGVRHGDYKKGDHP